MKKFALFFGAVCLAYFMYQAALAIFGIAQMIDRAAGGIR